MGPNWTVQISEQPTVVLLLRNRRLRTICQSHALILPSYNRKEGMFTAVRFASKIQDYLSDVIILFSFKLRKRPWGLLSCTSKFSGCDTFKRVRSNISWKVSYFIGIIKICRVIVGWLSLDLCRFRLWDLLCKLFSFVRKRCIRGTSQLANIGPTILCYLEKSAQLNQIYSNPFLCNTILFILNGFVFCERFF